VRVCACLGVSLCLCLYVRVCVRVCAHAFVGVQCLWMCGWGHQRQGSPPPLPPSQAGEVALSDAERDAKLNDYTTFDDYAEMIVQFGYVTLFVVSFPLAPLLAFISNYVEIRADALKILTQMSRPRPSGAEDIGTWHTILETMGKFSVISNLGALMAAAAACCMPLLLGLCACFCGAVQCNMW
jgi:Calcium-activated chloride channel